MDKLLGGAGFSMVMVGVSGMDSECIALPLAILTAGVLLIALCGYINGDFRQKNRPR